jgi:hypothetical protein
MATPGRTRHRRRLFAIAAVLVPLVCPCPAGSFPDTVSEFTPGPGAGFGQAYYPGNVLGPPHGNANPATPNFSEQDLLSLGDGGHIVLRFVTTRVIDLPGPDISVFENPLQPSGQPNQSFSETAIVSVSDDGTSWTTFPFDFIPPPPGGSLLDKANYVGFAGVNPVFSSPTNGNSPFDPAVSGGDFFDLAQIGLSSARYIRIQDTGTTGPTQTIDMNGDIVDDPGKHFQFQGAVGFDLDAVAAIHSEPTPSAEAKGWELYE